MKNISSEDWLAAFGEEHGRFDKIDVEEMVKILQEDAPHMTDEERRIIAGWLSRALFIGVDSEKIKETFLQTIKPEDGKSMKHAATVFMENMLEEKAREKAITIAKNLLKKGIDPDTVAESTDLDILEVLRLKGEM